MPEPPSLPSAFGIEAVQWLGESADSLTVRVQGRWRRRRPSQSGPAMLVIESEGRRHRFPAMPEPPSLAGAAPGTWQMTFSVPASCAPGRADQVWLQLGGVVVPVPLPLTFGGETAEPARAGSGVADTGEETGSAAASGGDFITARRLRSAELALEAARRRAIEAEAAAEALQARIDDLERALIDAQREPARLQARLAERERSLRIAEQHAYAESRRRLELDEELAALRRAVEQVGEEWAERADYEARVAELEDELERLRRRAVEAEHALAAARARTVAPVPPQLAAPPLPAPPSAVAAIDAQRLRAEARLGSRPLLTVLPGTPAVVRPVRGDEVLLDRERAQRDAARTGPALPPDAARIGRALPPATPPEPPPGGDALRVTLGELREELLALRAAVEHETAARATAEQRADALAAELAEQRERAGRAYAAIAGLRAQLATFARAEGPPPPDLTSDLAPPPADPPLPAAVTLARPPQVDPHRLADALIRLRSAVSEEASRAATSPSSRLGWLAPAFAGLLRSDPDAAGSLLLALLPLQGVVHPGPLAYDLVVGPESVVRVEVADGRTTVGRDSEPRPLGDVAFALRGSAAADVRLLLAGPLRRRLRVGVAAVRGNREAVAALERLIRGEFAAAALTGTPLPLPPVLVLSAVAAALRVVAPPEPFLLRYAAPAPADAEAFLVVEAGGVRVGEGAGPAEAPPDTTGPMAVATLRAAPEQLLAVIADAPEAAADVEGDARALALVRQSLGRAGEQ